MFFIIITSHFIILQVWPLLNNMWIVNNSKRVFADNDSSLICKIVFSRFWEAGQWTSCCCGKVGSHFWPHIWTQTYTVNAKWYAIGNRINFEPVFIKLLSTVTFSKLLGICGWKVSVTHSTWAELIWEEQVFDNCAFSYLWE